MAATDTRTLVGFEVSPQLVKLEEGQTLKMTAKVDVTCQVGDVVIFSDSAIGVVERVYGPLQFYTYQITAYALSYCSIVSLVDDLLSVFPDDSYSVRNTVYTVID